MNFEFNPAEQAFAEEVRGFLRAHPPETFPVDGMDAGYGSGVSFRDPDGIALEFFAPPA